MRVPAKSNLMRIITLSCLIAILATSISLGCGSTGDETKRIAFPLTISDISLVQVWDKILEETAVQDDTVKLEFFDLQANTSNNTLLLLAFQFQGKDAGGKIKYFNIGLNGREISWYSSDADPSFYSDDSSYNPLRYFEELDKYGLENINPGYRSEVFIKVDIDKGGTWGVSRSGSQGNIEPYHLKDGELIPLNKINFYTVLPVGKITVSNGSQSMLWFLTEDIGKAETVEYLETQ